MQTNHPIPQNVTQYQFRLVGDMTLKQFLELAGGLLLAYLFFSSNLIFLLKYPLALLSAFLGVALAFFPIEDRPLDTWIINFVKAIYSPTRFVWKKSTPIPPIFTYTAPTQNTTIATTTKTIKAPPLANFEESQEDLDPNEKARLANLDILMQNQPISKPTNNNSKPAVAIRKLRSSPLQPSSSITHPQPTTPSPVATVKESVSSVGTINSVNYQKTKISNTISAQTISLPATPTTKNIVSGLIVNAQGKLVENAIVQIENSQGIPVRAVKSNALGQFMISTPLENGDYFIEVEADNTSFPRTSLSIDNEILPPIKIQATS